MGKKNKQGRKPDFQAAAEAEAADAITVLGKKVIGAGVAIIILGFIVLSRADAMGRNWAARLSPFLILGGYVFVGLGIFAPKDLSELKGGDAAPSASDGVSGSQKTI